MSQSSRAEEAARPLAVAQLTLTDYAGRRRRGSAVLLANLPAEPGSYGPDTEEDFRIVVLSEPPEAEIKPPDGVAFCAPARRLEFVSGSHKEAAAPYSAAIPSTLPLSNRDAAALRQGRLFARAPLRVTPQEIFAGGRARLTLLARELLVHAALTPYLQALAVALSAPAPPKRATLDRLDELGELIAGADGARLAAAPDVDGALSRLRELRSAAGPDELLTSAVRLYPDSHTLLEDVYLVRAFLQDPEQAAELQAMRRFLSTAFVPPDLLPDLALDLSLVAEQLTFATLATEPQRLPAAITALTRFRQRYGAEYREHHTRYWSEMARLHARLMTDQAEAESLRQINTIAELGPPAGVGALAAFDELLAETGGCPLIAGVEEAAAAEGVCPACSLTLDREPPAQRAVEILTRIQRACDRQMARLSSSAIQQVLRRGNDARVDQFLKMVQATQLSSLRLVLDDDLVGYIRRFLVESRIHDALSPILDQLQTGAAPTRDEAQSAMRDVSQVLQRAFQAAQRALPPAPEEDEPAARRRRKR